MTTTATLAHGPYPYPSTVIKMYIGPMFSSKSTLLVMTARRLEAAGCPYLLLSSRMDTRPGEEVVATHSGMRVECRHVQCLMEEVPLEGVYVHTIMLDESQFTDAANDLLPFALKCVRGGHCQELILVGLDSTFDRKTWPWVTELAPYARKIKKLSALCSVCHQPANASALRNQQDVERARESGSSVLVGTANEYMAVCNRCHDLQSRLAFQNKPATI